MRPSLKLSVSSNPVAFVKGRVVRQPNAAPSVQLSRNAKTSVSAILVVWGIDGLSREECQTHVEQRFRETDKAVRSVSLGMISMGGVENPGGGEGGKRSIEDLDRYKVDISARGCWGEVAKAVGGLRWKRWQW